MSEKVEKLKLVYWESRGRGHPIRMLLSYLDLKYDEKIYKFNKREEWFEKDKQQINMNYPNLPYIDDNGYKLSDSAAIMNYIPQRFERNEMLGKNLNDRGIVQQLMGLTADFRAIFRDLFFDENWKEKFEKSIEQAREKIKIFDKILGQCKWLVGDYLTIVDFFFYEYVQLYFISVPNKSDDYQNINRFIDDFSRIPQINRFMKSSTNLNSPGHFPTYSFIDTTQYHKKMNKKFLDGYYDN
ncbi:Thioredoxin-like fold [Pseudocohnilembus persalinus]|uniref:glutathione transferase n=1 Tax=Pseudocohnilembus persalinus TaxID=266149 RepID=A0A0V0R303_PSEPJ|nr:Thioredoxin-like fold [Pseudocohnilembus persalinus]|eukprot:KRX08889.1 Thioredoxin-like fold [Pseudocohnilembus persalinus]